MKRMDLGHDPEPIVVNGSLFPLTSVGFVLGLYFLKRIDSLQVSAKSKWHLLTQLLEDSEDEILLTLCWMGINV